MQLSCIHCGSQFTISAQQLGGRGRCPRCGGEIELPHLTGGEDTEPPRPFAWAENSISALGSFVFHMALFLILALIVQEPGGTGIAGEGEEVGIGKLPTTELSRSAENALQSETVSAEEQTLASELEMTAPTEMASESLVSLDIGATLPSAGGAIGFDTGTARMSGGSEGGGSFGDMVRQLQRNGLDIVIVFDSTGSMGGEISEVKSQIKRIGNALTAMIPKTRISLCTYRDDRDAYTVMGQPLSDDVQSVANYLSGINAGGGGDMPEAVEEGMKWAVANNKFNPTARKVMLIFGDAPPHAEDMKTCLEIASDFSRQQDGIVSTVTCRAAGGRALPEFVEIAQAGNGEAFLTSDERQIMTQLLVLVFGSKHRGKVLEAFKLLDD